MKKKRPSGANASQENRKESEPRGSASTLLDSLSTGRAILLICLVSFLAYSNALGGEFVFDDREQIVENQDIRSWSNLSKAFTTHVWAFRESPSVIDSPPPLPYYRPVFTALLTIEYHLFGLWPAGWHLVSLLLHILCSTGVFYVILLMSDRKFFAITAALFFSVHPAHAESVSWISGMTDPLFSVFFLASFYWYLKYRSQSRLVNRSLIISLALFEMAAFSKETALSLVLLILGYEMIEATGSLFERLKLSFSRALPYLAASLIYLIPRYLVLGDMMFKNPQAPDRPFLWTILTLPFVIASYFWHLVWPVGLSVTYYTHFIKSPGSVQFILPAVALAVGFALVWAFRSNLNRDIWKSLLLIFVPLLPVLNLGQISQEEYLVFDHYLYLSVAGWACILALIVERLSKHGKKERSSGWRLNPGIALATLILISFTALAARENRPWADSFSVWSNAAKVRPEYWAPHYNAGLALLDRKRSDEAQAFLDRAAKLKPDEPGIFDALGRACRLNGDAEGAKANFNRALSINPRMIESLNNLGTVYFDEGDYATAEKFFREALGVNPRAPAVEFNLARCYLRQNRFSESIGAFERYLPSFPDDAEAHYELGLAYDGAGRKSDAISSLQSGISIARSQELKDKITEELARIRGERR